MTGDLEFTTREEIESHIQHLEEVYRRFQNVSQQLQAEVSEEDYKLRDATEKTEFEDRYFAIKASLLQCIDRLRPQPQASISNSGSQTPDSAVMQVLEQQTMLQRLAERSADSGKESFYDEY